ncbi:MULTISPECIES: sulfur carrier protein ThiS [Paenarthrobacter]|jgi:sulfur carrier protein|uniref:sulfur carrier protein ThiS n=1 Tax=Paenarthrobacter TaxID=1742992 RepID=UPI00035C172D|nr:MULTISPECIES: sulfur carrier protein ThiS [Paenarthrobacter]KQR06334.1 thiamine biosynthesis protein ThiS [Arthrobacter sp. Leaf145]SKB33609.1 sulfur carrier protein [Arthrobacter sp. 31Cvi3.1E]MBP2395954.1 sulfur carrier protein [Paenarthrobacter nicotinovorans]QOT22448.1 sulfur carrier protein ThiS [Paenarthrobacter sp. YJN-D]UKE97950.1 sulfur carrier protein ThiS [Paenarthrobacter nicotinovorans]
MNIKLNGAVRQVPADASVSTLVTAVTGRVLDHRGQAADGGKLGVAVARNSEVVPRSQWAATPLADGDELELVTAVQGG